MIEHQDYYICNAFDNGFVMNIVVTVFVHMIIMNVVWQQITTGMIIYNYNLAAISIMVQFIAMILLAILKILLRIQILIICVKLIGLMIVGVMKIVEKVMIVIIIIRMLKELKWRYVIVLFWRNNIIGWVFFRFKSQSTVAWSCM